MTQDDGWHWMMDDMEDQFGTPLGTLWDHFGTNPMYGLIKSFFNKIIDHFRSAP